MRALLKGALRFVDRTIVDVSLGLGVERPALISFLFHSLFADRAETEQGAVDPFQPVTVDDFAAFIGHFKAAGYRFVAPHEIAAGLAPDRKHICVTFDDGYANNLRMLPVLDRFGVPATVFVSTNHVRHGRCFWWDVQYRRRMRQGWTEAAIGAERDALKKLAFDEIEGRLTETFGESAFDPEGEADRPLTEAELRTMAAAPLVTIGNHTTDHAILTEHDDAQVRAQIAGCQAALGQLLGEVPPVIAYPNGNYDARTLRIAGELGYEIGFTVEPRKSRLPLSGPDRLRLPRYAIDGGPDTIRQCRSCQSDLQLRHSVRRLRTA